LACIYEELDELEKANNCLDNYIHFDESNAEVYYKKGVNLCELGCTLEAQHHLQQAVEINPNHSNAQFYMGFLLFKTYSYSPALRHFKKTIELEPDYIGKFIFFITKRGILLPCIMS
jgi:tetratricopeptide (TPR) repeat protein